MGHGFNAVGRMCPPPRSLAAEANGASWSGPDAGPTEYKVAARCYAPKAGSPPIVSAAKQLSGQRVTLAHLDKPVKFVNSGHCSYPLNGTSCCDVSGKNETRHPSVPRVNKYKQGRRAGGKQLLVTRVN